MKRLLITAALAWLVTAPLTRAQDEAPACGTCKKTVSPTIENVKHICVNYDVKEEDYAYTRGVCTPILSRFCRDHCGNCGCQDSEPCHNCGKARTRKVLIKEFVTEEVPTAKCRVDRVSEPCHACPTPANPEDMVLHPGEVLNPPKGTK